MQNPYAKYKQQSVMTMTQGDMINLLYDEIINRLNKGLLGLEVRDFEASNTHFKKAQAIISHLESTLDGQYPVSQNLSSLYEYFNYQIVQANIKKNPDPVREVLPMIMELKEAFAQADKQVRMSHTG
ncbi:flagellar export chaperone FliS [Enterocloster sp. OA13]|uniref:flagellar export chaperone FliS n=1 Tax=Enterocloster TaxID=2719313 RepID=UPI000472CF77|nr:flagellar export chaperone FliS [Lachnoclostridium pacaense]MCC2820579.1 flagellar export chaperone FliS [Lachnoclostridium pacaense]MCH1952015.1 flagellar export chaperone FliS [Enterocloster sp. OA13]